MTTDGSGASDPAVGAAAVGPPLPDTTAIAAAPDPVNEHAVAAKDTSIFRCISGSPVPPARRGSGK